MVAFWFRFKEIPKEMPTKQEDPKSTPGRKPSRLLPSAFVWPEAGPPTSACPVVAAPANLRTPRFGFGARRAAREAGELAPVFLRCAKVIRGASDHLDPQTTHKKGNSPICRVFWGNQTTFGGEDRHINKQSLINMGSTLP